MMTGCYPPRVGFGDFDGQGVLFPGQGLGLNPDEVTIARLLRGAGYATALVGKWHCGDQPEFLPTRHGFDRYFGLPYSNDMGRQEDADMYPPLPLLRGEEVIQQQPDQMALTERYTEECVRFMRERRDRPFFLAMAHMHVHLPLYAADRFVRESRNGRYGACVEAIDWSTAALLRELAALGLERNTLVIFTSDNGSRARGEGGSNLPLRGTKGTTWEGGLRVPCVMRWPDGVPAGRVRGEVATAMDFLPTFAALAGAAVPADRTIDGRSILPLMQGDTGARSPHETFFYYFRNQLEAARRGRWKLFVRRHDDVVEELYDLQTDTGEERNVIAEHPDVAGDLKAAMDVMRRELGDSALGIAGVGVRPAGRVANPRPLTQYDPSHPYIMALYDLKERG
jgi:arylsulfatase A-like enzyme